MAKQKNIYGPLKEIILQPRQNDIVSSLHKELVMEHGDQEKFDGLPLEVVGPIGAFTETYRYRDRVV